MGSFVHFQMWNLFMRIMGTCSGSAVRKKLGILIKKVFISFISLFRFEIFQVFFNLLLSFVEMVASWSWSWPILLFSSNQIKIWIFTQTLVHLVVLTFFLIISLVPWVFEMMISWRRECFYYFDMIIHVKASSSYIVFDPSPVWVFLVLPFSYLFNWILIDFGRLIFSIIPRNIPVSVIGIDKFRVDGYFFKLTHE